MTELLLYKNPLSKPVRRQMPSAWSELSPKQLIQVAEVLHLFGEDFDIARGKLLRTVTGMSKKELRNLDTAVAIEQLFPLMEWMNTEFTITSQLFPVLKAGRRKFYGPCNDGDNIIAVEFDFAERELFYWHTEKKTDAQLWRFVACLYRPKKSIFYNARINPQHDPREAFNDALIGHYAGILQKALPVGYAYAIKMWYIAYRQMLSKSHPRIFNPDNDKGKGKSEVPAYFGLMRMVAEKGTYGTYEDVEKMFLNLLLYELEMALDESIALKKQYNKSEHGGQ